MKAWFVMDLNCDEGYATVVFAESRGMAKVTAMSTDACIDADYVKIRATRIRELDPFYRGKSEMDWYDPEERRALVQYAGMRCIEVEIGECRTCPASDLCDTYQDWRAENGE